MAQSSWPFENIDTSETQFSQWARNIGEGVIAGKGLELEAFADSTGMTVKVKSGQALVRGHYYSSSAEETLTVPTANPTNPRIDLIVARLDPAANSIVLALVAGTPAGSPVAPTPTQTEADVYELPIAEVYVGAGVVTITAGNVTDVRTIFTPGASGAGVVFSDIAPEDTDSIWFNTENGNAYLYYDGFWTSISGISIPAGGTTGQVLAKSSNTDYATEWVAPSGLVYLGQTSWSAVTTVSIDNVFSATYDNYKCFINVTSTAISTAGMRVRLRAGGVDLTTSYELGEFSVGAAYSQAQSIVNSISLGQVNAGGMDVNANGCELTLYNPFTADRTNITSIFTGGNISLTGTNVQNTNSYDGLTIFTSGGNFAGTLTVYGIRKS